MQLTTVEPNLKYLQLARKYFGLRKEDRQKIITGDGISVLSKTRTRKLLKLSLRVFQNPLNVHPGEVAYLKIIPVQLVRFRKL